jgi:hypothetical protein
VPLDIGDHCEPVVGGKLAAVALYIGAEVDALLGGPVHGIAGGTSLAVTRHAVFLVPHLAGGAERVVDPSAASTRELMPAAIASASATPPARATPQLRFTMAPCLLGLSRLIASLGGPLQVRRTVRRAVVRRRNGARRCRRRRAVRFRSWIRVVSHSRRHLTCARDASDVILMRTSTNIPRDLLADAVRRRAVRGDNGIDGRRQGGAA